MQEPLTAVGRVPSTISSEPALHGYLNVLKPPGFTSHDVVAHLRRLSGQRRVGHTGTLDPSAVGVLPVAFGQATKTVAGDLWDVKLYWADVHFGASTDTDDAEGRVVESATPPDIEPEAAMAALSSFLGDILQRPPSYSALHVGEGRRAYDRARRGDLLGLPPRPARVDAIAVVGWRAPVLSLLIQCRSGTYVRSLARDVGRALDCPAHLGSLARLRVGPFVIGDALDLASVAAIADQGAWGRVLWPLDIVGWATSAIVVGPNRYLDLFHGRGWLAPVSEGGLRHPCENPLPSGSSSARAYTGRGEFLGFVRRTQAGWWHPARRPGPSAPTGGPEIPHSLYAGPGGSGW